jgi:metal-responsive CopG/Arc/MetJ family transcriptional regulator
MVAKAEPPLPRVIVPMRQKLVEQIDDFRFSRRLPSRAEAIRQLIETGLRHAKEPKPARPS